MQLLAALAPFAPFAQTLLWVALVAGLVIWLNRPLRAILLALQRRVESGSTVKAGPFEISDQLRPLDPEKQRAMAQLEVNELLEEAGPSAVADNAQVPVDARSQYFQAEDLALRALQADFGVTLSRQVTAGPNTQFDAAFVREGRLQVVEVKYYLGSVTPTKLRTSIERIAESVRRFGWFNVGIVLVLVFKRAEDIAANDARVREVLAFSPIPVDLHCYALPELRKRFGFERDDG